MSESLQIGDRVQWMAPDRICEGIVAGRWEGEPWGEDEWNWNGVDPPGWIVFQSGDTIPEMIPDGEWIAKVE